MQENRQRKKTDGIKHIIGTADSGDVPHDGSRLCHALAHEAVQHGVGDALKQAVRAGDHQVGGEAASFQRDREGIYHIFEFWISDNPAGGGRTGQRVGILYDGVYYCPDYTGMDPWHQRGQSAADEGLQADIPESEPHSHCDRCPALCYGDTPSGGLKVPPAGIHERVHPNALIDRHELGASMVFRRMK